MNQRAGYRVPVRLEADIAFDGYVARGVVNDGSVGGVSMVIPRAGLPADRALGGLQTGYSVALRMFLASGPRVIPMRVAWSRMILGHASSEDVVVAGLAFTTLDASSRGALLAWLHTALVAVQLAGERVVSGNWIGAAEALAAAGFDHAGPEDVARVLRYAAAGSRAAISAENAR